MYFYAPDDEDFYDEPTENTTESSLTCAHCLNQISAETVLICSTCNRRAFCSKQCQLSDLSINDGTGQGHRFWCSTRAGEEGIDWHVALSPGKGLGVFALRSIQSGMRIMVDRAYHASHPALSALAPGAKQFKQNTLCGEALVCARVSLVNHSCVPNAGCVYDSDQECEVVYAQANIDAGDEICVSYHALMQPASTVTPKQITAQLKSVGITCPAECVCRSKSNWQLILKSRKLYHEIQSFLNAKQFSNAFKACKLSIPFFVNLGSAPPVIMELHYLAFISGIADKKTLKESLIHMQIASTIQSSLFNPKTSLSKSYAALLRTPSSHPNYLVSSK